MVGARGFVGGHFWTQVAEICSLSQPSPRLVLFPGQRLCRKRFVQKTAGYTLFRDRAPQTMTDAIEIDQETDFQLTSTSLNSITFQDPDATASGAVCMNQASYDG